MFPQKMLRLLQSGIILALNYDKHEIFIFNNLI
ncbi:MAG: hypothetical protein BMS9Abin03_520 [Thermodesulfobacteriota bacterium]|nr:MAG: hypothetical protein BMS9Abin03_520 [Thermodesulfobacteriota bacterium]